jgi:hypothetical protein
MLEDIVVEWTDWPEELQTITGFEFAEYLALKLKLDDPSSELTETDADMMREGAKQFFGYPGMTTSSVERSLGPEWLSEVESAFLNEDNR